jgi:hypothetical protein
MRRTSIYILGGAVALPLTARGQQPQIPVVGFLSGASCASLTSFVAGVLQGIKEVGFIDGQNAAVHESGFVKMLWGERRGRGTFGAVSTATDGVPHVAGLSF